MKEAEYLIIGNSISGVNCVEGIREVDKKGDIIVVSDEDVFNYSRPLISYYLAGKVEKKNMSFRDKKFYQKNRVTLLLSTVVTGIDTRKKIVETNKGKIKFKKLLISSGGKPIFPPIDGIDKVKDGIFTFTRISDAEKMINYIEKNRIKEAVVLGGGLIGIKCTEGLMARGIEVKIIELADRILPNTLDKVASGILEKSLEKEDCQFLKENTVVKVEKDRNGIKLFLKSGKEIKTKLFVVAIGVKPNVVFLKGSGIEVNRGIVVNEYMETNFKDIFAAGDVAEGKDFLKEANSVIAIWPVGARGGKTAGKNMAGERTIYSGFFPMNSVELADIPVISFGITNPKEEEYEILKKIDKKNNVYKKIILKDNVIVGGIFLGKIERAGIFSGLIREKINVSKFKEHLLEDDFGLLILPEEYRKHLVKGEGIEV